MFPMISMHFDALCPCTLIVVPPPKKKSLNRETTYVEYTMDVAATGCCCVRSCYFRDKKKKNTAAGGGGGDGGRTGPFDGGGNRTGPFDGGPNRTLWWGTEQDPQDWADDDDADDCGWPAADSGPGLRAGPAPAPLPPPPWQWAQCMHTAQFPSFRASTALNFKAGPSFMFMVPVRCSSLSSGNAVPSTDCSRKHCKRRKKKKNQFYAHFFPAKNQFRV